jgi:thiamine transporter ThiT
MNQKYLQKMILSAMFLAMAIVLPFFTGQIPSLGQRLLPMHIPILICGFACGPKYGSLTGFIAPILRSLLFGMPVMVPMAIAMAFELATYGFILGVLANFLRLKNIFNLYIMLIIAMILGRMVFGLVSLWLFDLADQAYSWQIFTGMAIIDGIPGILLQLLLIPAIIYGISPYIERQNHGLSSDI